jgi:hypothetical protein
MTKLFGSIRSLCRFVIAAQPSADYVIALDGLGVRRERSCDVEPSERRVVPSISTMSAAIRAVATIGNYTSRCAGTDRPRISDVIC